MDELNYVYNRSAANLRGADVGLIGLVINDLRNPFFTEFAASAQMTFARARLRHGHRQHRRDPRDAGAGHRLDDRARRLGLPDLADLCRRGRRVSRPSAAPASPPCRCCAGSTRAPTPSPSPRSTTRPAAGSPPSTCSASASNGSPSSAGLENRPVTEERMAGYRAAMAEAGPDTLAFHGRPSRAFGRDMALALPAEIEGVICFSDLVALGMLAGFAQARHAGRQRRAARRLRRHRGMRADLAAAQLRPLRRRPLRRGTPAAAMLAWIEGGERAAGDPPRAGRADRPGVEQRGAGMSMRRAPCAMWPCSREGRHCPRRWPKHASGPGATPRRVGSAGIPTGSAPASTAPEQPTPPGGGQSVSDALPERLLTKTGTGAMTVDVPQSILDALTDVAMPRLPPERPARGTIAVGASALPVHRHGCVVVGSGAAGLRAAVELNRRGGDVVDRQPERLGRHLGLLRLRQADPAHRQHRRPRRRLQGDGPARSAPAARWTRTPPMSRRSAPRGRWPRCSISACRCRRTRSAARCATRPTTTRSAAPPAAARAPRA